MASCIGVGGTNWFHGVPQRLQLLAMVTPMSRSYHVELACLAAFYNANSNPKGE